jgi:UDP-3-O-[3-hydroxymyristoyl] glucosamine N-acyltransferase
MKFTARQIAQYVNGTVEGDNNAAITTFSKIEEGVEGAITFLANPKYEHFIYTTKASVVLVNNDFKPSQEVKVTLIRVPDAYECIAKLLQLYEQTKPKHEGVSPLAFVAPTAKVGRDVYLAPFAVVEEGAEVGDGAQLYPHATVGAHAKIGKNTILYANAVVYHDCVIGNNCILHSGCVIGADGFGFAPTPEGYDKIPQIGIVTIEDDVELGANTCVDRSTMGTTLIKRGVKLDNLVQIAHNVVVGENTVMSAQCGVAGSTKIGSWCMFGGQVGITGHAVIGDKTRSGAQAGIAGSIPKGNTTIIGSPAIDWKRFARSHAVFRNLPDLSKEVYALRQEIDELKKQLTQKQ